MNDEFGRLTHSEILELLPAFVVGALDPDEMLEIEEYIHAHPELMARVHELELAAAKLAYAAPPQPLPKELHAAVMGRARASLPSHQQLVVAPRPTHRQAQSVPHARENSVASWWRRHGFSTLGLVAAVAAALAIAVLYRGALVEVEELRRHVQTLEQDIATTQARNAELLNENRRLQSEVETQQNQLASITGAQHMVTLGGTEAAPNASARLYVHDTTGTLVMHNMAALGENQVYQLWLIPPDGAPIPAGLLGHAGEPVETITLNLPTTLDTISAVGVSVEPPSGSEAPTGPIVLLGERA